MVYLRRLIDAATERQARIDYRAGYAHGVAGLNPPTPDDLSTDYWRGYRDGRRIAHP
jgi:hypothetical protein